MGAPEALLFQSHDAATFPAEVEMRMFVYVEVQAHTPIFLKMSAPLFQWRCKLVSWQGDSLCGMGIRMQVTTREFLPWPRR